MIDWDQNHTVTELRLCFNTLTKAAAVGNDATGPRPDGATATAASRAGRSVVRHLTAALKSRNAARHRPVDLQSVQPRHMGSAKSKRGVFVQAHVTAVCDAIKEMMQSCLIRLHVISSVPRLQSKWPHRPGRGSGRSPRGPLCRGRRSHPRPNPPGYSPLRGPRRKYGTTASG